MIFGCVQTKDGDAVAAIAQHARLVATFGAFALYVGGSRAVTWGEAKCGGDSSQVRKQLVRVQQISATRAAFAAIREDGSVVTWGDPDYGGDSSQVGVK